MAESTVTVKKTRPGFMADTTYSAVSYITDDYVYNSSEVKNDETDDGFITNTATVGESIGVQTEDNSGFVDGALPNISVYLPDWGYSDFMQERLNWQKGLHDIGGEPGWFYFRVFFHFNTASGLFGGQLGTPNRTCAKSYFTLWEKHYPALNLANRASALNTFCNMLNNISNKTPWFFQSVSGMDKARVQNLEEPFKDNTLEIKCMEESVDMRLTNLFEYYNYACFDYVNLREILPENLRKFDMSVVVFGVPLRYLDTHAKINGAEYSSRTMRGPGNGMTMAMYTFKDCEFDTESMSEPNIADMSNAHAFQNNNVSIKIKYKRVFNYKANGFSGAAISSFGMISDTGNDMSTRLHKMAEAYASMRAQGSNTAAADSFVNKFIGNKTQFSKWYKFARSQGVGSASKALIDETEAICQDYYNNTARQLYSTVVGNNVLGSGELGSITPPDTGVNTPYYKRSIKNLHDGTIR